MRPNGYTRRPWPKPITKRSGPRPTPDQINHEFLVLIYGLFGTFQARCRPEKRRAISRFRLLGKELAADTGKIGRARQAQRTQAGGVISSDRGASEGQFVLEPAVHVAIRDPLLLRLLERLECEFRNLAHFGGVPPHRRFEDSIGLIEKGVGGIGLPR